MTVAASCRIRTSIYLPISVSGLLCQRSHEVEGHVHETLNLASFLQRPSKLGAMASGDRTRVSTEVKVEALLGNGDQESFNV